MAQQYGETLNAGEQATLDAARGEVDRVESKVVTAFQTPINTAERTQLLADLTKQETQLTMLPRYGVVRKELGRIDRLRAQLEALNKGWKNFYQEATLQLTQISQELINDGVKIDDLTARVIRLQAAATIIRFSDEVTNDPNFENNAERLLQRIDGVLRQIQDRRRELTDGEKTNINLADWEKNVEKHPPQARFLQNLTVRLVREFYSDPTLNPALERITTDASGRKVTLSAIGELETAIQTLDTQVLEPTRGPYRDFAQRDEIHEIIVRLYRAGAEVLLNQLELRADNIGRDKLKKSTQEAIDDEKSLIDKPLTNLMWLVRLSSTQIPDGSKGVNPQSELIRVSRVLTEADTFLSSANLDSTYGDGVQEHFQKLLPPAEVIVEAHREQMYQYWVWRLNQHTSPPGFKDLIDLRNELTLIIPASAPLNQYTQAIQRLETLSSVLFDSQNHKPTVAISLPQVGSTFPTPKYENELVGYVKAHIAGPTEKRMKEYQDEYEKHVTEKLTTTINLIKQIPLENRTIQTNAGKKRYSHTELNELKKEFEIIADRLERDAPALFGRLTQEYLAALKRLEKLIEVASNPMEMTDQELADAIVEAKANPYNWRFWETAEDSPTKTLVLTFRKRISFAFTSATLDEYLQLLKLQISIPLNTITNHLQGNNGEAASNPKDLQAELAINIMDRADNIRILMSNPHWGENANRLLEALKKLPALKSWQPNVPNMPHLRRDANYTYSLLCNTNTNKGGRFVLMREINKLCDSPDFKGKPGLDMYLPPELRTFMHQFFITFNGLDPVLAQMMMTCETRKHLLDYDVPSIFYSNPLAYLVHNVFRYGKEEHWSLLYLLLFPKIPHGYHIGVTDDNTGQLVSTDKAIDQLNHERDLLVLYKECFYDYRRIIEPHLTLPEYGEPVFYPDNTALFKLQPGEYIRIQNTLYDHENNEMVIFDGVDEDAGKPNGSRILDATVKSHPVLATYDETTGTWSTATEKGVQFDKLFVRLSTKKRVRVDENGTLARYDEHFKTAFPAAQMSLDLFARGWEENLTPHQITGGGAEGTKAGWVAEYGNNEGQKKVMKGPHMGLIYVMYTDAVMMAFAVCDAMDSVRREMFLKTFLTIHHQATKGGLEDFQDDLFRLLDNLCNYSRPPLSRFKPIKDLETRINAVHAYLLKHPAALPDSPTAELHPRIWESKNARKKQIEEYAEAFWYAKLEAKHPGGMPEFRDLKLPPVGDSRFNEEDVQKWWKMAKREIRPYPPIEVNETLTAKGLGLVPHAPAATSKDEVKAGDKH